MGRVVDFDAIQAEVSQGEPVEVRVGDTVILVHPEWPWDSLVAWDNGDTDASLKAVVVDPDQAQTLHDALFAGSASRSIALKRLAAVYSVEGESKASQRSSTNGGRRSRPTSKTRTT